MGCWGLLGVAGMIVTSDDWDHSLIISPQKAETLLLWNVSVNGLHVFQPRYCLGGERNTWRYLDSINKLRELVVFVGGLLW